MKTTINQRIREIADKMCGGNVSELARMTGVNQPALRDILGKKQRKPGFEVLSKIASCATLQISGDWLLTGKGSMQKHSVNILHNPSYRDVGRGSIPVYNAYAARNLHELFANKSDFIVGELSIPKAPACDGAIYVRESSMYPIIKGDDLVAYKQLHNIDNLMGGEMYLIDFHDKGDDIFMIRYVYWEEKNSTLRLVSFNEQYGEMIIPASGVRTIAHVKMVISISSMT